MNTREKAEFDQNIQTLVDVLAPTCRSLYLGFCREGFSCREALELVKVHLATTVGNVSGGSNEST